MKIALAVIAKDDSEIKQLARMLDSVRHFVDDIFITANGKETKFIEKMCKDNDFHYSYLTWNDDFSEQRNFNFEQAYKYDEYDYILWADTDDAFVNPQHIREVAEIGKRGGKDVLFLEYWYACRFNGEPSVNSIDQVQLVHQRERLIRPHTVKWVGRLHETPVPVEGSRDRYTGVTYKEPYDPEKGQFPIAVAHLATEEGLEEKMVRNKRILTFQLKEERKREVGADPRTLLYLMKIYTEDKESTIKEWDETLKMGEEYLTKSGWDEERGTCWELMGQVWGHKGNQKKAVECFHKAIGEWAHNILFYIRLATAYYNLEDYRNARHWAEVGSKMDMDKKFTSGMTNYHAIKAMYTELLVKLNYNVDKDVDKAFESAKLLYQENPSEGNRQQVVFLENSKRLNDACRHLDKYTEYLYDIGEERNIIPVLDKAPDVIQDMPFAQKLRKKFAPPRRWGNDEICYFANFNANHFFKWDSSSIETGTGGSETAVIKLAEEWAKQGYKVTVYNDPVKKGVQNGVSYLPYYYFNVKDYFNIFVQWRGWQLSEIVKCRRFYVDLHDIYSTVDLSPTQLNNIDKIMVKSPYHRGLAPTVPSEKFMTIPHGI